MPSDKKINRDADYAVRFKIVGYTAKWSVTMTKVRIRQAAANAPWPRWHILGFSGRAGGESTGVVDLIAIRKDHAQPSLGLKRGDAFQIILIQVKGGYAANPTAADGERLRIVARRHRAHKVLLAAWKKGKAPKFFTLRSKAVSGKKDWIEVDDLRTIFQ